MAVVARGLRWGGSGIRRGGGGARRRTVGFMTAVRAVMVKELRGRMRGRRAFVVLTIYLLLLGLFSYGVYQFVKQSAANSVVNLGGPVGIDPGFRGGFDPSVTGGSQIALSASIGHALFSSLIMLETLLVLVLAPAFTTGAISLEREKQTLELLVTTPVSTLGMVVGKLVSALVYVFLLIIASVPFVSIVFPFGGVGPEDLVRAYLMLFALAFGMGAIGLFVSALVRRTQTATVLTFVLVLSLTLGSAVVHAFWFASSQTPAVFNANGQQIAAAKPGDAPEALLWLNPFVSDADLICTTAPGGTDVTCSYLSTVTRKPYFGSDFNQSQFGGGGCPPDAKCFFPPQGVPTVPCCGGAPIPLPMPMPAATDGPPGAGGGVVGPGLDTTTFVLRSGVVVSNEVVVGKGVAGVAGGVANDVAVEPQPVAVDTFGYPRDTFWPHSTVAFIGIGALLTLLSAQLVAPTRRSRLLRRPSLRWRRARAAVARPSADPAPSEQAGAGAGVSATSAEPAEHDGVSAAPDTTPTESPA
jgi:ABC-type transport system involved in multi-copper enzyme maturation permease subunit